MIYPFQRFPKTQGCTKHKIIMQTNFLLRFIVPYKQHLKHDEQQNTGNNKINQNNDTGNSISVYHMHSFNYTCSCYSAAWDISHTECIKMYHCLIFKKCIINLRNSQKQSPVQPPKCLGLHIRAYWQFGPIASYSYQRTWNRFHEQFMRGCNGKVDTEKMYFKSKLLYAIRI